MRGGAGPGRTSALPARPRVSLSDWHHQNKRCGRPHSSLHLAYIDGSNSIPLGQAIPGPCGHGTPVESPVLRAGFKTLADSYPGRKPSMYRD